MLSTVRDIRYPAGEPTDLAKSVGVEVAVKVYEGCLSSIGCGGKPTRTGWFAPDRWRAIQETEPRPWSMNASRMFALGCVM